MPGRSAYRRCPASRFYRALGRGSFRPPGCLGTSKGIFVLSVVTLPSHLSLGPGCKHDAMWSNDAWDRRAPQEKALRGHRVAAEPRASEETPSVSIHRVDGDTPRCPALQTQG